MKTRDELLAMAEELALLAAKHARYGDKGNDTDAVIATGLATTAQACVMLAKEMREAKEAPTYEQVDKIVWALSHDK